MAFSLPSRRVQVHPSDEAGLDETALVALGRTTWSVPVDLPDVASFGRWVEQNLPLVDAILVSGVWLKIQDLQQKAPLPAEFAIHLREAAPVPPAVAAPDVAAKTWDPESMVRELVKHYDQAAKTNRGLDGVKAPFPFDAVEPGNNFRIVGRAATYDVLLKGAGEMYKRFSAPSADIASYRSGPFFFAMVAFPGAGKTTLGRRGWSYLMDRWDEMGDEKKQRLLNGTLGTFRPMVESSRAHNLVMFHEVANSGGRMLPGEEGLRVQQVLGLRTLYMITHDESRGHDERYYDFLHRLDMNSDLQGLKKHITFQVVLKFLVQALDLDGGSHYMATFFFDEVNAVDCTVFGRKAQAGEPTWFQEMMSEYVDAHYELAKEGFPVFPVFSIATTRYSAGDLKFTASRKSTAVLVPFPPLSTADAEEAVLEYVGLVAKRLNREVPNKLTGTVMDMIRLSGGMPRYISSGLSALREENFSRELGAIDMRVFLDEWRGLLSVRSSFEKYLNYPDFKDVLLKALAMSVLGIPVRRCEEVLPGKDVTGGTLKWWELEWSGITALTAQEFTVTDDPGTGTVLVKLCPILLEPLLRALGNDWPVCWPPLTSTDPSEKEVADACCVLLRIFLYQKVHAADEFVLDHAFPTSSFIPQHLKGSTLRLSNCEHRFKMGASREQVCPEEFRKLGYSAIQGPGNDAADWYVFCDGETIAGESKLSKLVDNVTVRFILKCYERLGKYYKLPEVSAKAQKLLDEVAVKAKRRAAARGFVLSDKLFEEKMEEQRLRSTRSRNPPSWLGDYTTEGEVDAMLADDCAKWDVEVEQRKSKRGKVGPFTRGLPLYVFCSTKPVPIETMEAMKLLEDEHPWVSGIIVLHEREAANNNDALSVLRLIRILATCSGGGFDFLECEVINNYSTCNMVGGFGMCFHFDDHN